jgi:hypothetical protein
MAGSGFGAGGTEIEVDGFVEEPPWEDKPATRKKAVQKSTNGTAEDFFTRRGF